MFEQAFKNIDDLLHKDAGCGSKLDYVEQPSFLCETYDYLRSTKNLTDIEILQKNTDNASVSLRKLLLESCSLHTVLDLPGGTFTGAGVKTVVLFFEKGAASRKVWYYQLNLYRNLGKTNSLNEKDLEEFVELQKTFAESENSWSTDVTNINQTTFDLSAKNPNKKEEAALRQPKEILKEMKALDKESAAILNSILELI